MENVNQTCLILNKSILEKDMFVDYSKAFEDRSCWHKFIIKNVTDIDKCTIINGFFNVIAPASLLPVKLKRDMFGSVEFIAKSCKAALEALVKNKLTITITHKSVTREFSVDVLLQYCSIKTLKIDVDGILYEGIQSRFNASKHELNLERFHMEKELDSCYCPLSQPRLLRGIIHLSQVLKPRIIRLGKNEITAISNMKVFNYFSSIEEIDLRNNLIDDLSKIDALYSLNLKHLVLDGNPLCRKYANARDYVNEVKKLFPTLLFLDNMALIGPPSKPINNFLCRFEGMSFVNSFMSSFFTAYDNSREALTPMYNSNAMFSLNIHVESDEYKIFKFTDYSRNLLGLSARIKHQELLTLSQRKIMELFVKLPRTKHDVFSFKTDLLIFSGSLISFVVSGMFREIEEEKITSRCCTFSRHFILRGMNFSNYTIVNDMLNVSQTTELVEDFSLFHHPDTSEILPSTTNEVAILEDTFEKLSNLDTSWSKWYLEENEYDIIKSLHMLIRDIHVGGVIPEAAFKPQVVEDENENSIHISQISINMSFKGEMFESDDPIQFEDCGITDNITFDQGCPGFLHLEPQEQRIRDIELTKIIKSNPVQQISTIVPSEINISQIMESTSVQQSSSFFSTIATEPYNMYGNRIVEPIRLKPIPTIISKVSTHYNVAFTNVFQGCPKPSNKRRKRKNRKRRGTADPGIKKPQVVNQDSTESSKKNKKQSIVSSKTTQFNETATLPKGTADTPTEKPPCANQDSIETAKKNKQQSIESSKAILSKELIPSTQNKRRRSADSSIDKLPFVNQKSIETAKNSNLQS